MLTLSRRSLDIVLFGALLLLGALVVRGWMREDAAGGSSPSLPGAPTAPLPPLRPLDAVRSAPPGNAVDLLALVDPAADRVAGDWTRSAGGLRSPVDKWARLRLPCLAAEEYDLKLTATRLGKNDALILGLMIDGRRAQVVLDGNGGRASWFEVQGGVHGISDNGVTYFQGPVFGNGRPAEIAVTVRKGRTELRIDGFQVLVWRGKAAGFYVADGWSFPQERALYVGAWLSDFELSRIEYVPLGGPAELLR